MFSIDKADVYVNHSTALGASGTNIFVVNSHLKVLLEEDYLALGSNVGSIKHGLGDVTEDDLKQISELSSQVIKDVLIPEIEKEVNEGKIFANLRQIYNSMILAVWYKKNLKESLLGQVYVNQGKIKGVELEDNEVNQKIYEQYVKAFEKGVYDFIKEDYDSTTQQIIPRKYFSGGINPEVVADELRELSDYKPTRYQELKSERVRRVRVNAQALGGNSDASDGAMLVDVEQVIDDQIIKGLDAGNTVMFVGAGISRNSGLPVVWELEDLVMKKLGIPRYTGIPVVDRSISKILRTLHASNITGISLVDKIIRKIVRFFRVPQDDIELILNSNLPFESFMEILDDSYSITNHLLDIYKYGRPNNNHKLMAKLVRDGKLKTIVTTNFDQLIEKALEEEKVTDYEVLSNEEQFAAIDWDEDKTRIIKIHGSIEDEDNIAVTLKRVAMHHFSKPSQDVIEHVFAKGAHENVLVLGYSSSDIFDISPHIQLMDEGQKNIYYLAHSSEEKVKDITDQKDKNPFKRFTGHRVFYDTDKFIEKAWKFIYEGEEYKPEEKQETEWRRRVNAWAQGTDEASRPFLIGNIFSKNIRI